MTQSFNSPWVGALAANLSDGDLPAPDGMERAREGPAPLRWDLTDPAGPDWPRLAGGAGDGDADGADAALGEPGAEAEVQATERDVSVYQIGFTLLIGVGVAVGLSTAMLLR